MFGRKGELSPSFGRKGALSVNSKKIINLQTSEIYDSKRIAISKLKTTRFLINKIMNQENSKLKFL